MSTLNAIALRPMTDADINVVADIERASASWPWTPTMFREEMNDTATRGYWVAEIDGAVVGFAGLWVVVGEGHLTNIAVDPQVRRRGVATQLLLHTVRNAIARDCTALTLEVRVSNSSAIALYARFGFAPAGVRKGYYPDNHEDALILWVHDVDTADYGLRLAGIAERAARTSGAQP
jgi:ribosomal-protein-alanine N-acetyltransferase